MYNIYMKAEEAMKLLQIKSRVTLSSYVKKGYIKVIKLPTGRYSYDEQSIKNFLNGNISK